MNEICGTTLGKTRLVCDEPKGHSPGEDWTHRASAKQCNEALAKWESERAVDEAVRIVKGLA